MSKLLLWLTWALFMLYATKSQASEWKPYIATAYYHGCTCDTFKIVKGRMKCERHPTKVTPRRGANGKWPEVNWTVAAPKKYPFGTVLEIGHGGIVTSRIVGDRGGAIGTGRLDFFVKSCEWADIFGVKKVWVRVKSIPLGAIK